MWQVLASTWKALPHLTLVSVVDILLVAVLIYQAIRILRGRRAANVLSGLGILLLLYVLSIVSGLELMRTILETMAPYTAFALIVMFQSEIRRVLSSLSEGRIFSMGKQLESREVIDEIVLAVSHLAKESMGALIVLEGEVGLRTFIESGVPVEAQVTRDLLLAIFYPGGSLHDGAVIVQGGRLAAAACFLPLTMNPELSLQLGTRHRAAIGVTEESDCTAVVVSEETGRISVARRGILTSNLSLEDLAEMLGRPLGGTRLPQVAASPGAPRQ
jgi:diadenylate cyclase